MSLAELDTLIMAGRSSSYRDRIGSISVILQRILCDPGQGLGVTPITSDRPQPGPTVLPAAPFFVIIS